MVFRRNDHPNDVEASGMTALQRAYANMWYVYGDEPELQEMVSKNYSKCAEIAKVTETDSEKARDILQNLIPGIDKTCNIVQPFTVEYADRVRVGKNTFINHHFYICSSGLVEIGENCFIGPFCNIYTPNHHPFNVELRRAGWQYDANVKIGNDVWFGGSVTVCPGVTIGNNVVVGAGSVITKDIPDNCVVGGNPAKVIKHTDERAS